MRPEDKSFSETGISGKCVLQHGARASFSNESPSNYQENSVVVIGAAEVKAISGLLRASHPDHEEALKVLRLLERLPSLGEVIVKFDANENTPNGSVFQPYNVDENQFVFPVAYHGGFEACPITLFFAPSQWRYMIMKTGATTIGDLYKIRISDIPWRDKTIETTISGVRQKVDEFISENTPPPSGYSEIPKSLSLETPAKEVIRRISTWLPHRRREIFERSFGLYGRPQSMSAVARSMGLSFYTPITNIRSVFSELGQAFDWSKDYNLIRSNVESWNKWTKGMEPSAIKLLEMFSYCHGFSPGKYGDVEIFMGNNPLEWEINEGWTPKQALEHLCKFLEPKRHETYIGDVRRFVSQKVRNEENIPRYIKFFTPTIENFEILSGISRKNYLEIPTLRREYALSMASRLPSDEEFIELCNLKEYKGHLSF